MKLKIKPMMIMICVMCCVRGLLAAVADDSRAEDGKSSSAAFRITHGPYVQQVTDTSATIIWCTEYRYSVPTIYWGTDSTLEYAFSPVTDGLVDVNLELAKVTLENLQPGTTYYYKAASRRITLWTYLAIDFGDDATSDIRQFTTLNKEKNKTSFMVVNDLAGDIAMMDSLLFGRVDDEIDFIFLNGNILAGITDQEAVFKGVVDPCCRLFADRLPFHLIRGVQECRGVFARRLPDYFGAGNFQFYSAFSQGPVRFIILDSGEDDEDVSPQYANMNVFENYRVQQKEWLEQEVTSDEFLNATYRVVICHLPIYGGRNHFGELDIRHKWGDLLNLAKIDLFIAGNSDRYTRIDAGVQQNQFPILIGAGVGANLETVLRVDADQDNLTLTAMQKDGTVLDRFALKSTGVMTAAASSLPNEVVLQQNYPNPFNNVTCLTYALPQRCRMTLKVYNTLGQEVRSLQDSYQNAGVYKFFFDSRDLTSGVYYIVLTTDTAVKSKKITFIR